MAFLKIILDDHSKNYLFNNLSSLENELNQLLVLNSIFEQVRDAKLKSTVFADKLLNTFLPVCLKSEILFESALEFLFAALSNYTPPSIAAPFLHSLFTFLL